jgi:hypothetical protein
MRSRQFGPRPARASRRRGILRAFPSRSVTMEDALDPSEPLALLARLCRERRSGVLSIGSAPGDLDQRLGATAALADERTLTLRPRATCLLRPDHREAAAELGPGDCPGGGGLLKSILGRGKAS